ncbi:MAG TPA: hypothetical protein VHB98_03985, partial [Chloroflexota bacterium]|nr:hypothetical protein [Chloroflexota bacterium]
DDQASFIVQAFAIDLAMGVQRIEVNRMVDGADFATGGEPLGLLRNDGTPRPALFAYRAAASLFAGVTGGTVQLGSSGGIASVVLQRPGERITVLWDQRPAATVARLQAHAPRAMVYDKFGQAKGIRAVHGTYTLRLTGATDNTNPANPRDYVIGGSPWIVVEQL